MTCAIAVIFCFRCYCHLLTNTVELIHRGMVTELGAWQAASWRDMALGRVRGMVLRCGGVVLTWRCVDVALC